MTVRFLGRVARLLIVWFRMSTGDVPHHIHNCPHTTPPALLILLSCINKVFIHSSFLPERKCSEVTLPTFPTGKSMRLSDLIYLIVSNKIEKPMILYTRSTSRSMNRAQNNKILWLSNMADTFFFERITRRAKVCGHFFLIVLFGCWLAGQAITWVLYSQTVTSSRFRILLLLVKFAFGIEWVQLVASKLHMCGYH